jgi:hypothetical protein
MNKQMRARPQCSDEQRQGYKVPRIALDLTDTVLHLLLFIVRQKKQRTPAQ